MHFSASIQLARLQFTNSTLADLGFLEGVTLGTQASEASEHWEGLGLLGHKTTSK